MAQDTTEKGTLKRKRRSRKGLSPINDVVTKAVKKLKLSEKFDEYEIRKNYKELFGNEIAKASHPEKLIRGKLYINVTSSAWLMQLSFMKDEMVKKITEMFNKKIVRDIVFRVGRLKPFEIEIKRAERMDLRRVKLDDKTKKKISESVKGIKDNALKKSIIAAETAYYKRKILKDS